MTRINVEESLTSLKKVLGFVKSKFVGKDEVIDILGIALLAGENAFLYGPPGTAKSAIVRAISGCVGQGQNFEYLLTRFTEPNELFGPFDIRKLREGELITNTQGMLPEASMVFLDEIFNANSAILNSLLTALNEKIFRRGKETLSLPALMFVGASNNLPEEEALAALFDRFLLRVRCGYVDTDRLNEVLHAGWKLNRKAEEEAPIISASQIRELQTHCNQVSLEKVLSDYVGIVHAMRNAGIDVSDRRAVKFQSLLAASALMCGRQSADQSDFWVLKHVWDNEEQVEILKGLINAILDRFHESSDADVTEKHPQSTRDKSPSPEVLAKEINYLSEKWSYASLNLDERNVIKDKLRFLQSRVRWVGDVEHKSRLQAQIDELWQKMLTTS